MHSEAESNLHRGTLQLAAAVREPGETALLSRLLLHQKHPWKAGQDIATSDMTLESFLEDLLYEHPLLEDWSSVVSLAMEDCDLLRECSRDE